MSTITLTEVEADPVGTFRRVEAGECFVVLKDSRPVAEIKPLLMPSIVPRPYGLAAGLFRVPEDFDNPLPEEILRQFEGDDGREKS